MKNIERCPLCDSTTTESTKLLFNSTDYISGDTFSILKCNQCNMTFTNPCPDQPSEIVRYYPEQDYYGSESGRRFNSPIERMVQLFRELRLRKILGFKEKGTILDIGCGRGLLLRLLKSRGWECYGTELSERLASHITETYNINVRALSVHECNFPDSTFDVVTLNHVLEHLSDPKDTIREVRRIIKDDGLLIIGVPNLGSLQSVLSKSKWFHLDVPRHAVHFTHQTLSKLIEDCGFKIVSTRSFSAEYDPYGLMQSILNVLGSRKNFLYELLRRKKLAQVDVKTLLWDIPLNLILPVVMVIPAFILEYALSLVGRNGTIEVLCRPVP